MGRKEVAEPGFWHRTGQLKALLTQTLPLLGGTGTSRSLQLPQGFTPLNSHTPFLLVLESKVCTRFFCKQWDSVPHPKFS